MKKLTMIFLVVAELLLLSPSSTFAQVVAPAPLKALILYDAPAPDAYQKLGFAYAIMLRNLLGHWNTTVDLVPIQSYVAGGVENYNATFYLGSYYNNPIPTAFMNDVSTTQKTVVWFKYNLWTYAWNAAYNFNTKYGFSFNSLLGMNAPPSATNPKPGFYDTVSYKGMSMVKYYDFNATTGTIFADPDAGITQIIDPAKASALANLTNGVTNAQAPYIVRSGNFWYFADLPLSFIGPRDRYLVLCDVLHDIMGQDHAVSHKALVRLEDVSALVSNSTMKTLTDYMFTKKIPFSIATIPRYVDALGVYNGGVPETIPLSQAGTLKSSLNYALARGGKILMHGYTHQYNKIKNKNSGVSADDFEFWNAVQNTPVAEDSLLWATTRLMAGLLELRLNGYTPFAWETPHYQGSALAIKAALPLFKTTYQRVVYYTADKPNFNLATGKDFSVGQFFPYIINKDYYGQRVLPENLGNIEYDIRTIDPTSDVTYTWQDLYQNAQYALVIRDGFGSFFFHPFWLEPDLPATVTGFADFQKLVNGVTSLGYTWADASTLQ